MATLHDTGLGLWFLRIVLGLILIMTGVHNLFALTPTVWLFEDAGLPTWLRLLVGLGQVAAGGMLVIPPLAFYGAVGAMGITLGLFAVRVINQQLSMGLVTLVFVLLALVLLRGMLRVEERRAEAEA